MAVPLSPHPPFSYYTILDLPRSATSAEVKSAYFAKAKVFHPDRNADKSEEERDRARMKFEVRQEGINIENRF